MTTSNRGVKSLMFNAVNFTNEVDDKGQKIKRSHFKRDHYLAVASLSKKLMEDQEVLFGDEEILEAVAEKKEIGITEEKIAELGGWKPYSELTDDNRSKAISNRFSNKEIEFTEKEAAAIKYFWKDCEEIGNEGIEAVEEMERLVA